jgi:hypothetical protein
MFKMDINIPAISLEVEARCPRHHYNPVNEYDHFKSGCIVCQDLFHAYKSYLDLRARIESFNRQIEPFLKVRKVRQKRTKSASAASVAAMSESETL